MLSPSILASLTDLEFVARVTVEGALSGLHRSPFHGYSAEFSQYRHYRPGDDLKYIDWKLFARTDRIYTKQFRETTNVRMQLVVDASASMGFRDAAGVSKLEYARTLAAALAHLVAGQGDACGLTIYDEGLRTYLASRPGRSHARALLVTLSKVSPHGGTTTAPALRRAVDLLRGRGALIVFSDLYEEPEAVEAELTRAARMGHDVSVFHILTPEEIEWPWRGDIEVEDSETGRRVLTSSAGAADYRLRMDAFIRGWRERCTSANIVYVSTRTNIPPAHTLREYLLRRGSATVR
ncbi:MAG TPA: DUF58 domain-containing protein [Vicinamibacterales bacterium]